MDEAHAEIKLKLMMLWKAAVCVKDIVHQEIISTSARKSNIPKE